MAFNKTEIVRIRASAHTTSLFVTSDIELPQAWHTTKIGQILKCVSVLSLSHTHTHTSRPPVSFLFYIAPALTVLIITFFSSADVCTCVYIFVQRVCPYSFQPFLI